MGSFSGDSIETMLTNLVLNYTKSSLVIGDDYL